MLASRKGHAQIVQLLSENDATLNILCHDEATPIYAAAQYNHLDVICVLLKFGANINFGKHGKIPPLSIATLNDAHETMTFLISHGCSFICDYNEQSSLAIAQRKKFIDAKLILLREGAGLCLCDDSGDNTVTIFDHNLLSPIRVVNHAELKCFLELNPDIATKFYDRFKKRQHELKTGVFRCIEEAINFAHHRTSVATSGIFSTAHRVTRNTPSNDASPSSC